MKWSEIHGTSRACATIYILHKSGPQDKNILLHAAGGWSDPARAKLRCCRREDCHNRQSILQLASQFRRAGFENCCLTKGFGLFYLQADEFVSRRWQKQETSGRAVQCQMNRNS